MKPLIQRLTEAFGPSGSEVAIRQLIHEEIKPLADEIREDALGNLIARKHSRRKAAQHLMLAAHMDEIGLMATHIDENGFVRFTGLGGVRPLALAGGRVRFMNGQAGVIGMDRMTDATRAPKLEQGFIDVGATSSRDCPIHTGDVCAFDRPFLDLGGRLVAKAMDDRIGCAILIEAMRRVRSSPYELSFVFTVQEEVGVRGATASAFGLNPDFGLAVDVTDTGDTPRSAKMEVALGGGPAVKIKDSGMLSDPRIVAWMVKTAEKNGLPYQREVLLEGSTDARAIQLSRSGIPTGCLSIPCRYIHSPSEMVDYGDIQNSVKLIAALLHARIDL